MNTKALEAIVWTIGAIGFWVIFFLGKIGVLK